MIVPAFSFFFFRVSISFLMAGFLDVLLRFESAGACILVTFFLVGYLSSSLVYLAFVIPGTGGSGLLCNVVTKMRTLHSLLAFKNPVYCISIHSGMHKQHHGIRRKRHSIICTAQVLSPRLVIQKSNQE